MYERTQDAMTYIRNYGKPNHFIIFISNLKWKNIQDDLTSETNIDQSTRSSGQCVSLENNLTGEFDKQITSLWFITVLDVHNLVAKERLSSSAYIIVVYQETQLFKQIDSIISAELLDIQTDPSLLEIAKSHMVLGKYGNINRKSPGMISGHCAKRYPKMFYLKLSSVRLDRYPPYKRSSLQDGGFETGWQT